MKRVIIGSESENFSLEAVLSGYMNEICECVQEKIPGLTINSDNIDCAGSFIGLKNLSIKELMVNVMPDKGTNTWYMTDFPDLVDSFRDPIIVDYVVSIVGPTFNDDTFVYIDYENLKYIPTSDIVDLVISRIRRTNPTRDRNFYNAESRIISAMQQYKLTIKGEFADPKYFRWMTVKELFGSNPVFDETGDVESDLDIAYSELESAISEIVPGFSISVDRSDSPRGQFIDVASFNFANKTRKITLKSVDLLKPHSSRGVKGLIMHILNRLSGKSMKGVSDIYN